MAKIYYLVMNASEFDAKQLLTKQLLTVTIWTYMDTSIKSSQTRSLTGYNPVIVLSIFTIAHFTNLISRFITT